MSDCARTGFAAIPAVFSRWNREFLSDLVDVSRNEGHTKNPAINAAVGLVESSFNTKPFGAGAHIANALRSGDQSKVSAALSEVDTLSASDKLEAACAALRRNRDDLVSNPNLPKLEITSSRINDGEPALKTIRVHGMSEIIDKQF